VAGNGQARLEKVQIQVIGGDATNDQQCAIAAQLAEALIPRLPAL